MNPRRASSEVDIDGGMSESEPTNEASRVAQNDEIVKQLEKSVPRWEGFGPGGWSTTIQLVRSLFFCSRDPILTKRFRQTLRRLLSKYEITRTRGTRQRLPIESHGSNAPYSGTRLSAILDAVPDMDSKPNFPQTVGVPDHIARL